MFKKYWWVLFLSIGVFSFLGLLGGGLIAYIQPKLYEASATIQLNPTPATGANAQQTSSTQFSTAIELITSSTVLERVAESLDLTQRWGLPKQEVIAHLQSAVTAGVVRGTDLVTVRVRMPNADDAMKIANSTVNQFGEHQAERRRERSGIIHAELKNAIYAQEDTLEEKRKVLMRLRESLDPSQPTISEQAAIEDAKADFETTRKLLEVLKIKLVEEGIEARIAEPPVTTVEQSVIPPAPVSPNVPLNLVLGTAIGFLAGLILAFPFMAGMHRKTWPC
jgi:uncharacterized protein involved in exopolysaccharide biosynthesis